MKPPVFDYHLPESVNEALHLLGELGDEAKVLAGGQSLMPLLNFRLAAPAHLVDINGLRELTQVRIDSTTVRLGALTRMSTLDRDADLAAACPLLSQTAPFIGHPQIRSRGTVGGSLAHADPSAELPGAMVALGATMHLRSARAQRAVAADDFFQYQLTTVLEPDELLIEIEIPRPAGATGSSFKEVAARHGDFAAAGVAAIVGLDDDGRVASARVACISAGPRPILVRELDALLAGAEALTPDLAAQVQATVAAATDPSDDLRASAPYKRRVTGVLARDALREALQRAHRSRI